MFLFQPLGTVFYQKGRNMSNCCYSKAKTISFLCLGSSLPTPHVSIVSKSIISHNGSKGVVMVLSQEEYFPLENECLVFGVFVDNVKETICY